MELLGSLQTLGAAALLASAGWYAAVVAWSLRVAADRRRIYSARALRTLRNLSDASLAIGKDLEREYAALASDAIRRADRVLGVRS